MIFNGWIIFGEIKITNVILHIVIRTGNKLGAVEKA